MSNKNLDENTWLAVIAGGQGTRLFPLSNADCPKQFCRMDEKGTFIQHTVDRFLHLGISPEHVVIITTNPRQTKFAKDQLLRKGLLSQNILEISPTFGYAGSMVQATRFVAEHDDTDPVVINTPADQYVVEKGTDFAHTIHVAVDVARTGSPVVVGVKVGDLVTAMGCGHAIFDPTEKTQVKHIQGFIEKPEKDIADQLMRSKRSAVNTGINVWRTSTLLTAAKHHGKTSKALGTDELMQILDDKRLAVGTFPWHDCGTLASLYDISRKTPNHKNASLSEGNAVISRTDCTGSLFITIEGVDIYAAGIHDCAVVVSNIEGKLVIAIVKLTSSQKVRALAEDYQKNHDFLMNDFSFGARNNRVTYTNISREVAIGFVDVSNHTVTVVKYGDGDISVIVSNDAAMVH